MKRNIFQTILLLTTFCSCDRVMPGGLWDKFETDLRVQKQSDQGPWGGTRSYYWKSETFGYFSQRKVVDFTSKNGWMLVDSINYSEKVMKGSMTNIQPNFKIRIGPFEPPSDNNYLDFYFPRWINSDLTLYKFKTGWLIFSHGTENSTDINGFVLISKDGKEMAVHHLWGE